MRFVLKRLFDSFVSSKPRRRKPNIRRSVLRFERLDERRLLATDATESATETAVVVTDIATAPAVDTTPLWTKDGAVATLDGGGGTSGYGQIPPDIVGFQGAEIGLNTWVFTGEVIDDTEVAGLTVTFGGLLEGHSTTVRVDGTFEYVYQFPPGTMGTVTAIVTDLDGLQSEQESYFIA